MGSPLVGLVMGSDSDWEVMQKAADVLAELGIALEARVLSAHRTPEAAAQYAKEAEGRGLQVIIAGAGRAAHLPGVLAAYTLLPVVGVPIGGGPLAGVDALYAMVQMPPGVPVATMAIDGATNAGLFAAQLLAGTDAQLRQRLQARRKRMADATMVKDQMVAERWAAKLRPTE